VRHDATPARRRSERSSRAKEIEMKSKDSRAAPTGGTVHGGTARARAGTKRASADDLSHLSEADRASVVLRRDRGTSEVPIERAFLEAALDVHETLRTLAGAVVPGLADWCWVDLLDEGGLPRRVEVAHANPAHAPIATEMRSLGFGPGWATPSAQAIRDRAPRVYRELTDDLLEWATHDARHLALLRAMRPNSLLAAPLVARGHVIGAITLIRSAMLPGLDEVALARVEELAIPAALALDNARRYEAACGKRPR
jgi:GAF domain-containing protein